MTWQTLLGGRAVLLRRARRLPPRDVVAMLHALAILIAIELLIRWVPLPRLSRWLGVRLDLSTADADSARPRRALPPPSRRRLAIAYRVAELWPFRDGPCLRRSLIAAHLVRCHDPSIRLGVAGEGESLRAHAWVEIDGHPLEDVSEFAAFRETTAVSGR